MKKDRALILIILLISVVFGLIKLDIYLRYNISFLEYIKYNTLLTEAESIIIRDKPLLIGIYEDPPLAFTNQFNNYNAGIMVDYLSQLAIEIKSDMNLRVRSESELVDNLKNREVDSVVLTRDPRHEEYANFTQTICLVRTKVLLPNNSSVKSLSDLNGKKLVTLIKENGNNEITNLFSGFRDTDIIEVDNMYQCFALMRNGVVEGFVGSDMEVAHFLNATNRSASYRFLDGVLNEKEMVLAISKDNPELLSILNKGILELKKKNLIAQTQYKWLGDFDIAGIDLKYLGIWYNVVLGLIIIVMGFSGWNYSITQKVNTRTRELSQSKEELRLIIDTMQSGIMVVENGEEIVECNNSLSRITGIPRNRLIGFKYKEIEDLGHFVKEGNFNNIINKGNSYFYTTLEKVTNDKTMIIIEDYTDKYLSEKKARQESKMVAVGQVSAGLAHEIRNPLGLIKSYIYVIEKQRLNDLCDHAIYVINDSVDRINKLIENLLRFSKLSNDEVKAVNIKKTMAWIIDSRESKLEKSGIEVSTSIESDHGEEVNLNEDVLRMTMQNIFNNSIDSFANIHREDKKIHMGVTIEKDRINIRIEDNGCGIEKEKLDNIFDPFYSTKENGTGLGLYITITEIINNHGSITVDSEYGIGTTFNVSLPIDCEVRK